MENAKVIESIQPDAARIITGATKVCSTQKLYDESGIEPLQNRRTRQKLCHLFKIINGLSLRKFLRVDSVISVNLY